MIQLTQKYLHELLFLYLCGGFKRYWRKIICMSYDYRQPYHRK